MMMLARATRGRGLCSRAGLKAVVEQLRPHGHGEVQLADDEGEPGVMRLKVSNPGRKNALSGKMMAELHDAVEQLETGFQESTVLLVEGTTDFFCAGADLSVVRGSFSREDGLAMSALMQQTMLRLSALPLISVAVINGGAMGGGTEFALACDFRVMHQDAVFQMVHTKLGLIPGWGGGSRLVEVVGRRNAIKTLCSGHRLDAAACLELGIADAQSADGEQTADRAARALAAPYAKPRYPRAVRAAKRILGFADDAGDLQRAVEHERAVFSDLWLGPDNLDALSRSAHGGGKKPPAAAAGSTAAGRATKP